VVSFLVVTKKDFFWKIAYLAMAGGVFMVDQATKAWAQGLKGGDDRVVIENFLNFSYAQNTGVAFSMFENGGDGGRWGLSAVAGVAAVLVLFYFWRIPRTHDRLLSALALLLAGIVGNLTDRARLGYVIDFIDVQLGAWHYPTFNVADMAICAGAGLLIIDMFLGSRKKTAEPQPQSPQVKTKDA
jgi:signal peptidase II